MEPLAELISRIWCQGNDKPRPYQIKEPETVKYMEISECMAHPYWKFFERWVLDNGIWQDWWSWQDMQSVWRPFWGCYLAGVEKERSVRGKT